MKPPRTAADPGYPDRARLLADPRLRRHALAVLAAVALGGCNADAVKAESPPPGPAASLPPQRPATPPPAATPAVPVEEPEEVQIEIEMPIAPRRSGGARIAPRPIEPGPALGGISAPQRPPMFQLLLDREVPDPPGPKADA